MKKKLVKLSAIFYSAFVFLSPASHGDAPSNDPQTLEAFAKENGVTEEYIRSLFKIDDVAATFKKWATSNYIDVLLPDESKDRPGTDLLKTQYQVTNECFKQIRSKHPKMLVRTRTIRLTNQDLSIVSGKTYCKDAHGQYAECSVRIGSAVSVQECVNYITLNQLDAP
ncbi:MAG: hypothetical protein AB7P04_15975 [Bacteriovoracia bacterium]